MYGTYCMTHTVWCTLHDSQIWLFMAKLAIFCKFLEVLRPSYWNYGGFSILPSELRITEPSNLTLKNTEVSVIFTDGWQHCTLHGAHCMTHTA